MSDLTRAKIEAIRDAEDDVGDYMYRHGTKAGRAITQLLRQLDAANAMVALHESENVTRGLLFDKLEAQLQIVQSSLINAQANAMVGAALREDSTPPDVAQAARVLPPNIIVRQAVTDDHAIAIRDLNAEDGGLEGVLVAKCDIAALIRCLRALLPEGGE